SRCGERVRSVSRLRESFRNLQVSLFCVHLAHFPFLPSSVSPADLLGLYLGRSETDGARRESVLGGLPRGSGARLGRLRLGFQSLSAGDHRCSSGDVTGCRVTAHKPLATAAIISRTWHLFCVRLRSL